MFKKLFKIFKKKVVEETLSEKVIRVRKSINEFIEKQDNSIREINSYIRSLNHLIKRNDIKIDVLLKNKENSNCTGIIIEQINKRIEEYKNKNSIIAQKITEYETLFMKNIDTFHKNRKVLEEKYINISLMEREINIKSNLIKTKDITGLLDGNKNIDGEIKLIENILNEKYDLLSTTDEFIDAN